MVAGVVADEVCELTKGVRPFVPLEERLDIVRSIGIVDAVHAEIDRVPVGFTSTGLSTSADLRSKIRAAVRPDTTLIDISGRDSDPQRAADLAKRIGKRGVNWNYDTAPEPAAVVDQACGADAGGN